MKVKWLFHGLSLLICIACFIILSDGIFLVIGIFNLMGIEVVDRSEDDLK